MRRTARIALAISIVALMTGGLLTVPSAAQDDITLVDLSLGFPYEEDFQGDDGGWTTTEVPPPPPAVRPDPVSLWQHGVPTSGPGVASSGSNVWATNLSGDYGADHCAGIMSPPIELNGTTSASMSFKSWLHSDASSFSGRANDAGIVFVTTDGGDTLSIVDAGYNTDILNFVTARCLDDVGTGTPAFGGPAGTTPPDPVYDTISADLTPLLGQTVQLVIAFGSNCCTHRDGWYIDDFTVEVDGAANVEDFEADDGGFQVGPVAAPVQPPFPKGWEWGHPTDGPGVAEGDEMWGTQLDEDYGHLECSWIESPPFQVGPIPKAVSDASGIIEATLSWDHWFRSNSVYASGIVQVGHNGEYHLLEPEGGYPGTIGSTSSTFTEVTQHQTDCFGLTWAPGDALHRGYSGTSSSTGGHAEGDPLTSHRADLSTYSGETITIRYLFASGWRDVNPTTYPGWFVDNVGVEVRAVVSIPNPEGPVSDLLGTGEDAPLWSSGGTDSSWGFGNVTATGSNHPTGEIAYGTNLDGDHNTGECSWIESPAIPGAFLAENPTLTFDHWYRMAFAFSATTATGGVVLVSGDGGATWEYLAIDEYERPTNTSYPSLRNCLAEHGVDEDAEVFTGVKTSWDEVTVSLADYVSSPTVKVRFLFGSHTSLAYEGWYIRDVVIGGQDVL